MPEGQLTYTMNMRSSIVLAQRVCMCTVFWPGFAANLMMPTLDSLRLVSKLGKDKSPAA